MPTLPYPLPVKTYLRCVNARSRPKDFVGDWLVQGAVYQGEVIPHIITNKPHVRIPGLVLFPPYDTFAAWRFRLVAEVWLN